VPPPTTIGYGVNFNRNLPTDTIVEIFMSWQEFARHAPDALAMQLTIGSGGTGIWLGLAGSFYGTMAQFNKTLTPLMAKLPSDAELQASSYDWIDGLVQSDGPLQTNTSEGVRLHSYDRFVAPNTCHRPIPSL
jgi:hypothetical protein